MASRSATTAALLVVVVAATTVIQATSAYVVPEVLLMRVKRNPEPMRSFSFSGFNPNGQMSAFTGMAEYPMFGANYGPPSQAGPYNYGPQPATQESYGPPQATQDSYGPPPSGNAGPQTADTAAADPNNKQQQKYGSVGGQQQPQEYGPPKLGVPADSKEQGNNSVEQGDNKKQRGRDGPSSNAEASFNAWFPIMFGVFPNGAGGGNGQSVNPDNRGNNNQGQGQNQGQGNSYGGNGYERSSGTTVIANSVSNGRHGVATSHAIAYGNPRLSQK